MPDYQLGTDVSDFQSISAWDRMVADGVKFAWVKQNQGSFSCQQAVNHRKAASARGVKVGGYSWAVFNSPARSSAETFVSLLHQGPNTLPPVLDVEDVYPSGQPTGSSPAQRADWVAEFQGVVETEMGQVPMLYTGRWYWQPNVENRSEQARWPLWLASYPGGTALPAGLPAGFGPWPKVAVWQYAGDVAYFGMNSTDLNVIHSDTLSTITGGIAPGSVSAPPQSPAPIQDQGGLFVAGQVTNFSNEALVQMATALNVGGSANYVINTLAQVLQQTNDHMDRNGMLEARAVIDGVSQNVNQHTDVDTVKGVGATVSSTQTQITQMQGDLSKVIADAIQKYGVALRATAPSA